MAKCRECGAESSGIFRERVGDQTFTGNCLDLCSAHGSLSEAVARHLAERGPVSAAGFRRMREAVGMKATELADTLGTRPATISQWERDAAPINPWAWIVLGAMVADVLGNTQNAVLTRERLDRLRRGKQEATVSVSIQPVTRSAPFDSAKRLAIVEAVAIFFEDARKAKEKIEVDFERRRKRGDPPAKHELNSKAYWDDGLPALEGRLSKVDLRFAATKARREMGYALTRAADHKRRAGVIATAAELAWIGGVEGRGDQESWSDVQKDVTRRFYTATRARPT